MGAKACSAKWRKITSSAKIAPAIGALKLAETAAATAHPNKSRAVTPCAPSHVQTLVDIMAAICTTGPSRPADPPVDKVIKLAMALAQPSFISTRPSRRAAASITSATDLTRPSWVIKWKIKPTITPPEVGIKTTQYHDSVSAKLCKRLTSDVP